MQGGARESVFTNPGVRHYKEDYRTSKNVKEFASNSRGLNFGGDFERNDKVISKAGSSNLNSRGLKGSL